MDVHHLVIGNKKASWEIFETLATLLFDWTVGFFSEQCFNGMTNSTCRRVCLVQYHNLFAE